MAGTKTTAKFVATVSLLSILLSSLALKKLNHGLLIFSLAFHYVSFTKN